MYLAVGDDAYAPSKFVQDLGPWRSNGSRSLISLVSGSPQTVHLQVQLPVRPSALRHVSPMQPKCLLTRVPAQSRSAD